MARKTTKRLQGNLNDDVRAAIEALRKAEEEIAEVLDEAYHALRAVDVHEANRARSYWYAHIKGALNKDNEFLGGSMCTLAESRKAMEDLLEGEEDEDEGDDE